MSKEITASFSLEYNDTVFEALLDVSDKIYNSAGKRSFKDIQTITTSEVAINLGGIANIGAFAIVNLDSTNYVELKVATSGAIFAKLTPDVDGDGHGGFVVGTCLGSAAQVPFAIANTASCKIAVLLIEQ